MIHYRLTKKDDSRYQIWDEHNFLVCEIFYIDNQVYQISPNPKYHLPKVPAVNQDKIDMLYDAEIKRIVTMIEALEAL